MIPRAISYELPSTDDLPPSRAPWALNAAKAALLIHDMQEHFVGAYAAGQEPIASVRARIAALLVAARAAGVPVFYTAQPTHQRPEVRGLLTPVWGAGIGTDAEAARIVADLAPLPGDTVLTKWRYDAFERSDLRERLADLGRDQLIVAGIYAHIGCQVTAVRAFMLDVEPFFVGDAVADFTLQQHVAALDLVADCAGVVTTTEDVLGTLEAASHAIPLDWDELRAHLAEATGADLDEIEIDTDLASVGLDSVRLMALAQSWSVADREVGFADLAICDTPADLMELLERVHGVALTGMPA